MMTEAQAVAEVLGVKFAISLEKRLDGAAEVGVHKTSMLQDLERGGRWRSMRCWAPWWMLGRVTSHQCRTARAGPRVGARTGTAVVMTGECPTG